MLVRGVRIRVRVGLRVRIRVKIRIRRDFDFFFNNLIIVSFIGVFESLAMLV